MSEESEMTDTEMWRAIKKDGQRRGEENRRQASDIFEEARTLAQQYGLLLTRHTDQHYSLRAPQGWIINLYPGNRRIFHDEKRQGPFLKLPRKWTLVDVVRAAADATTERP